MPPIPTPQNCQVVPHVFFQSDIKKGLKTMREMYPCAIWAYKANKDSSTTAVST